MKTVQHSKTSTSSNTLIYLYSQINDHIIMPIGLEDSLALINLMFVLYEASSTTGSPTSLSMLMEDSLNKAKNHTILESTKQDAQEDLAAYQNLIADVLLSTYMMELLPSLLICSSCSSINWEISNQQLDSL